MTYLEDGHSSLANNLSENAIRPFTVGRNYVLKNITGRTVCSVLVRKELHLVLLCIQGLNLTYLLSQRPDNKMSDEQSD